jgi:hypothetical protein
VRCVNDVVIMIWLDLTLVFIQVHLVV